MGRERVEYTRKGIKREEFRLFVIATEGKETEKVYFEKLRAEEVIGKRVYCEILPTIDGKSSPEWVLLRLDEFKKYFRLRKGDALYLLCDRDRWGDMLSDVAAKCVQKKYNLIVSNPCFELWLYLHFTDVSEETDEEKALIFENKKNPAGTRTYLELKLIEINGTYNKSNPDLTTILPRRLVAIENAKKLTPQETERWPLGLGTYIYKLLNDLLNAEAEITDEESA